MKTTILISASFFCLHSLLAQQQAWLLTGNRGTDTSKNFIGTKDTVPLLFKVKNQRAGFIDYHSTANMAIGYQVLNNNLNVWNTGIGYRSLYSNTYGKNNTANGSYALNSNTTGSNNTAVGAGAMYTGYAGDNNTAIGSHVLYNNLGERDAAVGAYSLYKNSTGYENVAVGYQALYSNDGGNNNTAIGAYALYSTNNNYNTAVGSYALYSNIGGGRDVAVGNDALHSNTSGIDNTAVGIGALTSNVSSDYNTAIGADALSYNKTGYGNTATGNSALYYNTNGLYNTADGYSVLYTNTTGQYNTASGYAAMNSNTKGNYNTAQGASALIFNSVGKYNTASGAGALNKSMGNYNTGVGANADVNDFVSYNNATAIGYNTIVDASDKVRIGNESVTSIGGQVGWTSYSDARIKTDIKENVPGLAFIKQLRPLTYHFNIQKQNELLGKKDTLQWETKNDIEKIQFTGLIAQEVDAAATKLDYNFSGIDKTGKIWGLRYGDFVVPLIKAVQELSAENAELKSRLDKLESQLGVTSQTSNSTYYFGTVARLEQNNPNPYNSSTSISYYLPSNKGNAAIDFYSSAGNLIKTIKLADANGKININMQGMSSGTYQYALVIDGQIIDKKQMILSH